MKASKPLVLHIGFCVVWISLTLMSWAHEGGHYHRSAGDALNRWEQLDGQVVYGNFSSIHFDELWLEGYEGKLIKLPLSALSYNSRRMAQLHQHRIDQLNEIELPKPLGKSSERLPVWIWVLLLMAFSLLWLSTRTSLNHQPFRAIRPVLVGSGAILFLTVVFIACKKNPVDSGGGSLVIPKSSIGFLDSAFAPYRPGISNSSDNNYYYVSSTGLPAHNMMVGITSWQQQVPIPQPYTGTNHWSIPLQPVWADVPLSTRTNLMKGAVAIAVNGIPIFNALNNRGVDSYATGELDQWGGHCGRADDYHYHAAPMHLSQTSGQMPIAFALDGFPVYGNMEPDGSPMQTLDTCHGHQLSGRVYHYHGTTTYPYVIGAMRGKVSLDPLTPAPENQILPQAFASPVRPATSPLNGAVITDFVSTGTNAYKLTYRQGARNGFVEYNWTSGNLFTYKLTDTAGVITINTYQR